MNPVLGVAKCSKHIIPWETLPQQKKTDEVHSLQKNQAAPTTSLEVDHWPTHPIHVT